MAFNVQMKWKIDPMQAVNNLSSGIRNKALRIALNAAAAPMKQAVIAAAPSDSGNLKKSIRIKVKNYKRGDTWVAVVGASSSYKGTKRVRTKTGKSKIVRGKDGKAKRVQPSRYQKLVDLGTKYMSGRHFMTKAFNSARQQFQTIARQKLKEQLELLMSRKI